jgi:maltooligosyltrehalose trehalohydrolase
MAVTMTAHLLFQGAEITSEGVRYCVWAPSRRVSARVFPADHADHGSSRAIPLARDESGFHRGVDARGKPGDRYLFELDGGAGRPCPASRWQPEGVHGPSLVVDARSFSWKDAAWNRPPFRDLVIYELHIGTFTPEGTFLAAIGKLPYLKDLGITAIEVMPVADFPGARNWGYDGVRLFAPAKVYGHPDDFRALVDAAHARGIAVILDVVYNHFGPDGNYLREFSPSYFEGRHHTPWGEAINFSSPEVRAFYAANLLYWMEDFHIDGFRLDATHTIFDDSKKHILQELGELVHQHGRYIIAEDERTEPRLVTPVQDGGFGLDAVWADDFHHTAEVAMIDASIYRGRFNGELDELLDTLSQGWTSRSFREAAAKAAKGDEGGAAPSKHLPPERFVFCISNHDQTGNRAFGERINHFVSPETYRAASALLCLIPCTPLLFMGQEWGASTPFQFFTDHHGELGRLVEKGRIEELRRFPVFDKMLNEGKIPSPQAPETFEESKLKWDEIEEGGHGGCLRLYREALRLRREHAAFRPPHRDGVRAFELRERILAVRASANEEDWLILCDLEGGNRGQLFASEAARPLPNRKWRVAFSSNDARFGGRGAIGFDEESGLLRFESPELLVLKSE